MLHPLQANGLEAYSISVVAANLWISLDLKALCAVSLGSQRRALLLKSAQSCFQMFYSWSCAEKNEKFVVCVSVTRGSLQGRMFSVLGCVDRSCSPWNDSAHVSSSYSWPCMHAFTKVIIPGPARQQRYIIAAWQRFRRRTRSSRWLFALQVCRGCHLVRYCSAECQLADWPSHRAVCRKYSLSGHH